MTEHERDSLLLEIAEVVRGLKEDFLFLRKHRNMLRGNPILEFDEVCSMLRQSERSVRRLRESGQLVGFTFGRRRFYSLREVERFIARLDGGQGRESKSNHKTDDRDQ